VSDMCKDGFKWNPGTPGESNLHMMCTTAAAPRTAAPSLVCRGRMTLLTCFACCAVLCPYTYLPIYQCCLSIQLPLAAGRCQARASYSCTAATGRTGPAQPAQPQCGSWPAASRHDIKGCTCPDRSNVWGLIPQPVSMADRQMI
jgi:hypothetical protein